MKTVQLTQQGFSDLQKEHQDLIKNKKPKAIDRLQKARAMGDLSENSEYTAAKEELAFVEGRIREIEEILNQANVVESHSTGYKVEIGTSVTISTDARTEIFQIVGEFEADPMNKRLSNTSPIGQALIDKKVGDIVEVTIPAGKVKYKIIEIK